ncbi:hypothetical protein [Aeromicrobium sp. 9AM]|uniref:hypothetical protein n=1 Tax=Aeromicrobium sp. 9AM TaxID=2653126 RepID=UPI0012F17409|nr:hypothetical protein [Aeromicrobium sp. 9AM]VXB52892.1 conserved exported hypothetical protein [Aeromicrobium sp. 9AM]
MKKSAIAIFATLAMVLCTAALAGPAQAAYPNTVATSSKITSSSSVTEGKKFGVTVRVKAGNATVSGGKVAVRFRAKTYTKSLKNGRATFSIRAPKVRHDKRYTIKAKYYRASGSIFKSSPWTSKSIKVINK